MHSNETYYLIQGSNYKENYTDDLTLIIDSIVVSHVGHQQYSIYQYNNKIANYLKIAGNLIKDPICGLKPYRCIYNIEQYFNINTVDKQFDTLTEAISELNIIESLTYRIYQKNKNIWIPIAGSNNWTFVNRDK